MPGVSKAGIERMMDQAKLDAMAVLDDDNPRLTALGRAYWERMREQAARKSK